MNPYHIAEIGSLALVFLTFSCKKDDHTKLSEFAAERYLFNQIFCKVGNNEEKTTREIDLTKAAFVGWLRNETEYQDYLSAWLREYSDRLTVKNLLISNFLDSSIKENPVNEHIAIVDRKGGQTYLLNSDKGFRDFYSHDASTRMSIVESFCEKIFGPE